MKILAIETSCDETAAAVVENGTKILSNVVASSSILHEKYGGVVPEIAARKQLEYMIPVLTEAVKGSDLDSPAGEPNDLTHSGTGIDAIAVTVGPGLIGSLLVGVETAKTLAFAWGKPIIPVNHVLAHMYANFVISEQPVILRSPPTGGRREDPNRLSKAQEISRPPNRGARNDIKFPAISLVVSGGHTELYLMESPQKLKWLGGTLDDAAGECFDKCARLLGFGSRGGVAIQEAAQKYFYRHPELVSGSKKNATLDFSSVSRRTRNDKVISLPRPMIDDNSLNFSFSGLKTAVAREWNTSTSLRLHSGRALSVKKEGIQQFAFEIQEAITDVLVAKTFRAVQQYKAKSILLSGGVAANLRLRQKFNSQLTTHNLQLVAPPAQLCTDNAVYIASYAYFRGEKMNWKEIEAQPDLSVEVKN